MTFILATKRSADSRQTRDAASWIGFAASPTFALMAWISANDMQGMICASDPDILPIGGMAFMYLLMSVFHLSPWVRIVSAISRQSNQPSTHARGD